MQRAKDYLLLSMLSYCNFDEKDYNKRLTVIFLENNALKLKNNELHSILGENIKGFYNFFREELNKWEVIYIDNRRASSIGESGTGFYSVVFRNVNTKNIVIAYRGSEKFPIEDAYKDFIETDLKIGLGHKPVQFYDGLDVFNKVYELFEVTKENISITGHSLGGGIAQFVSFMIDKEKGFIPYTCTWNAVGINRDGIINLLDFFNYEKLIDELKLDDFERQYFLEFKDEYLSFFLKELRKSKIIKDNNKLLIGKDIELSPVVDDSFVKNFLKNTNFSSILEKLSKETKTRLLLDNRVYKTLFMVKDLAKELFKASYFIKKVKDNKTYESNVANFCHSEDLTVSLFPHIGAVYQVDKGFIKKEVKKKTIFSSFLFFTKSVQEYHDLGVFIPFIETEGEKKGMFSKNLSIGYMGSLVRKIITQEYCVEKELLADYYERISINEINFKRIKNQILQAMRKCGDDILYKDFVYTQIKDMEILDFSKFWENLKTKIASPYRVQDIYDSILF